MAKGELLPAPEHTQPDESEPTTIKRRSIPTWKPILAAVVVLLVFVAVIGPLRPDVIGYGDATDAFLSDAARREDSATGAPQQAVVNGWVIRDLMTVQIEQANDALVLQYVMVIGLFVVVTLLWAGRRRPEQSRDDLPSVSQQAAEEAAHKSPGT